MTSKRISDIINLESVHFTDEFGFLFILVGVGIQVLTYLITGGSQLSVASGMCGIISVVLCSQKKVMFYIFGFAQLITYVMLCIQQRLYGEIAENVFYFVTMLYGMFHWARNYNDSLTEVKTRKLSGIYAVLVFIITVLLTVGLYNILTITDDTQPFVDAVTTAPAFVAQMLMVMRYKDSWFYWLIIDVGAIPMWVIAGDWCMVAQFAFWSANCIYGLRKW